MIRTSGVMVLVPALLAVGGSALGFVGVIPELTMRTPAMPPEKGMGLVRVESVLPDGRKIVRMVPVGRSGGEVGGIAIPGTLMSGGVQVASVAPASLMAAKPVVESATTVAPIGFRGSARVSGASESGNEEGTVVASVEAEGEMDAAAAEAAEEAGAARPTLVAGAPAPGERPTVLGTGWVPARNTPRAPSDLRGVQGANGGIILTWRDNSTNEAGFIITRERMADGRWAALPRVTVGADVTTYTDSPVALQMRYRVRAFNNEGNSAYTQWTSLTLSGATEPLAPTDLRAAIMLGGDVSLSWVDNSANETLFEVHREQLVGSTWGSTESFTVGTDSRGMIDSPGTGSFRYRVRAANAAGPSQFTEWVEPAASVIVPSAPTALQVVSLGDGRSTRASWVDNSSDESSFELSRETLSGSSWVSPATVTLPANTTQYDDQPGEGTHRYRVRASSAGGSSPYTAWVEVTVSGLPPAAPSSFQVVASGDGASASWLDNANNETGYELAREQYIGTSWVSPTVFALPVNSAFYSDTPGQGTFRYRVRAVNAAGASSYTSWSTVVIQTGVPVAPSGVAASDIGNARAMVSWTDNSLNETGFEIERSPAFALGLVSVGTGVTNYIDLCGPGSFSYRVRAVNANGASSWTGWASASVMDTPPAAPTNLTASDAGNQQDVNLNWVDNASNETGFRIERETQAGSVWGSPTQLSAAADAASLRDSPGTGTHRYRIAATNAQGDSAWTNWATTTVSDGWTIFTPSADTRIIYVSSSEGNDANDGLSEARPKRTIAAGVAQLRDRYPDWLMLKRNDVWTEGLGSWRKSGRSAAEPMVVQSYGPVPGERPLLRTGVSHGWDRTVGSSAPAMVEHLAVVGLHFLAHTYTGGTEQPVAVRAVGRPVNNLLFEDCMMEGYSGGVDLEGPDAEWHNNVRFRRCTVVDSYCNTAHSQGFFVYGTRGLVVEESLIDHNGWKEGVAEATMFNHNFYLSWRMENTTIRRNIIARASSHGVSLNRSGLIEDNLIVRNAIGIATRTQNVTVRGNVILEGRDITPSAPRGWGMTLNPRYVSGGDAPPSGPLLVDNNIIANKTSQGVQVGMSLAGNAQSDATSFTIRNNIIYNWRTPIVSVENSMVYDQVLFENNAFSEPFAPMVLINHGPSPVNQNRFTYRSNRYFSSAGSSGWFMIGGGGRTLTQWRTESGEGSTASIAGSFADPGRTVGTYYRDRVPGGTNSLEAFLAEARRHSRYNGWGEHEPFTAPAVIAYIREGFAAQ